MNSAIETEYNGFKFRSRLEARWAVFFDEAGIKYEYEPEGFEVSLGENKKVRYLPDFYFPEWDVYGEVKPSKTKLYQEQEKLSWMIDFNATPISKGLLILGQVPFYQSWFDTGKPIIPKFAFFKWEKGVESYLAVIAKDVYAKTTLLLEEYGDNVGAPELPTTCVNEDLTYLAQGMAIQHEGFMWSLCDIDVRGISADLFNAYRKARQARFEHGEKGR